MFKAELSIPYEIVITYISVNILIWEGVVKAIYVLYRLFRGIPQKKPIKLYFAC